MAWPTDITATDKGRTLEVVFDDGETVRLSRFRVRPAYRMAGLRMPDEESRDYGGVTMGLQHVCRALYVAALTLMVAFAGLSAKALEQRPPEAPDFMTQLGPPWTGDLDGMTKRRFVRFLVPYNKTLYMIDRGRQMGLVEASARSE